MTARHDDDVYPKGDILRLIGSDRMTEATKAALRARLATVSAGPATPVLNASQLVALSAIAARLIPQTQRTSAIDLVDAFHRRLADDTGLGWRYADLPPTTQLHQRGLSATDASAVAIFGKAFVALPPARQDELLQVIQGGRTDEAAWQGVNPALWFTELLATLVDIFYSHPLAQDEIGYAGMADAQGWSEVGLDAREAHEPMPLLVHSDSSRT